MFYSCCKIRQLHGFEYSYTTYALSAYKYLLLLQLSKRTDQQYKAACSGFLPSQYRAALPKGN